MLALTATTRFTEPRRAVREPRNLDLKARFAAAGVAMKYLDDDPGPIQHLGTGRSLEISELARD